MCENNLQIQDNQFVRKNPAVLKFGGSSVKGVGRMQHVANIIADACKYQKVVVVVSAMGDTTDHLLSLAASCTNEPDRRELDVLLSTGEQVSIALLSIILKDKGINVKSFTGSQLGILTENEFGSARILSIDSDLVSKALSENDVVVVAGFQGVTIDGQITTLGRGGSDTSAVALAAACNAVECQIFTDVDGIFTADPNKVAGAEFIPEISYDDCLYLTQNGAQVMHDRAVILAKRYGVKVRVRNTFNPGHEGTIISG